jgi:hypothetical protein
MAGAGLPGHALILAGFELYGQNRAGTDMLPKMLPN